MFLFRVFRAFSLSLLVTVVTEGALSFLLGLRSRKDQSLVLLVNLLTNPAVVYVNLLSMILIGNSVRTGTLIVTECAAVLTEALIYARKLDWDRLPSGTAAGMLAGRKTAVRALLLSVLLNAASYGAGEIVKILIRQR